MKTIILGMLGATMFGSVAQAACNDIPNPTRFNPQSLSAYQECWLDHYEEDDAGVLGSLAWIRLNDQYFSAPISLIRKMKGTDYADKFFAAIGDDLEAVAAEERETIMLAIADMAEINKLRAEIKQLKAANAGLEVMIAAKETEIKELKNRIATMYTEAQLTAAKQETWRIAYNAGNSNGNVIGRAEMRTEIMADINNRLQAEGYATVANIDELETRVREIYQDGWNDAEEAALADVNSRLISEGYTAVSSIDELETRVRQIYNDGVTAGTAVHAVADQYMRLIATELSVNIPVSAIAVADANNILQAVKDLKSDLTTEKGKVTSKQNVIDAIATELDVAANQTAIIGAIQSLKSQLAAVNQGSTPPSTPEVATQVAEEAEIDSHITDYGEVYSLLNNGSLSATGSYATFTMYGETYSAIKVDGTWIDMPFATVSTAGNLSTLQITTTNGDSVMSMTSSGIGYAMSQLDTAGKKSLKEAVETALENTYNTGFDDGYEAGYTDGYNDGYAAGVAAD